MITIVSKKSNSSNTLKLENDLNSITNNITKIFLEYDLDEISVTKFSIVIYHIKWQKMTKLLWYNGEDNRYYKEKW